MAKRNEKTPVYLILKPIGQFDEDGVELTILIDVKLTSAAADGVIEKNPGAVKQKWFADKRSE